MARLSFIELVHHRTVLVQNIRSLWKNVRFLVDNRLVSFRVLFNLLLLCQQRNRCIPDRLLLVARHRREAKQHNRMLFQHANHILLLLHGQLVGFLGFIRAQDGIVLVQKHQSSVHLFPARDVTLGAREFQIHGHPQEIGVDIVNSVPRDFLLPQMVEQLGCDERQVSHTVVVREHLVGSKVNAGLHLDTLDSLGRKLVRDQHAVLLRSLGEEVIIRRLGWAVELVLLRKQVVDGRAAVTKSTVRLQERFNDRSA